MTTAEVVNEKDLSIVGHVKVSLVADIGKAEMTVEELFGLRKESLVKLDQGTDAIITLLLNDKAIARGELVAVGDNLGVRITELV